MAVDQAKVRLGDFVIVSVAHEGLLVGSVIKVLKPNLELGWGSGEILYNPADAKKVGVFATFVYKNINMVTRVDRRKIFEQKLQIVLKELSDKQEAVTKAQRRFENINKYATDDEEREALLHDAYQEVISSTGSSDDKFQKMMNRLSEHIKLDYNDLEG